MAEQGVSNFSYYTWLCLVAPAGTPKDIVQRLSEALAAATATQRIKDRFRDDGLEAVNMTPEQFNAFMAREVEQVSKVVTDVGLAKQ